MAILPVEAPDLTFEVCPRTSADVFNDRPEANFWLGRVASLGEVEMPEYYDTLLRFRGNVYVHELGFLDETHIDDVGRESDNYDERSIHFAVIENATEDRDFARMVGSLRLITKVNEEDIYPIEGYFPEVFERPIDTNTAEVSRFIARYPEDPDFTQHMISLSLIRAATLYAVAEGVESYYCVIEKPLMRLLGKIGIPLEVIGEPKDVEEQGGFLYPVKIYSQQIMDSVSTDKTGNLMLHNFFEQESLNRGEGFYDSSFIGGEK